MFKKILIITSVLALAACHLQFPRKDGKKHNAFNSKDNKISFALQNQGLTKEAMNFLDEQVVEMKKNSLSKLESQVYCDKSISGYKKYNIEIANKRNQTIKDYLVKKGINASRITTTADGAEREKASKKFKSANTCTVAIVRK